MEKYTAADAAHDVLIVFGLTEQDRFWLLVDTGRAFLAQTVFWEDDRAVLQGSPEFWAWMQARFSEGDASLLQSAIKGELVEANPRVYAARQRALLHPRLPLYFEDYLRTCRREREVDTMLACVAGRMAGEAEVLALSRKGGAR